MLIKIPLDIWRDIFDYFHLADRRQLALKFNEIEDREYSDICQKWLHEWTKNVQLGRINILPPSFHPNQSSNELVKSAYMDSGHFDKNTGYFRTLPFVEVPMPDNIVDFKQVDCSYLDTNVLHLLHHMQPLFQGIHLSLCLANNDNAIQTAIAHLMPLFIGIDSLYVFYSQNLFTIRDRFPAQYFGVKLLILGIDLADKAYMDELVELLLRWLCTRRADGEPRMLVLMCNYFPEEVESNSWQNYLELILALIEHIRQHFLNDTSRVSFFVGIRVSFDAEQESTTITNAETNEQLVVRKLGEQGRYKNILIGRCPSEVDGQKWVEEIERKASTFGSDEQQEEERKRRIFIFIDSLDIGPDLLVEEEESGGDDDDGEDDVNQPGPSTKR